MSVSLVRLKGPRRRRLLALFGVALALHVSPLGSLSSLHPGSVSPAVGTPSLRGIAQK